MPNVNDLKYFSINMWQSIDLKFLTKTRSLPFHSLNTSVIYTTTAKTIQQVCCRSKNEAAQTIGV